MRGLLKPSRSRFALGRRRNIAFVVSLAIGSAAVVPLASGEVVAAASTTRPPGVARSSPGQPTLPAHHGASRQAVSLLAAALRRTLDGPGPLRAVRAGKKRKFRVTKSKTSSGSSVPQPIALGVYTPQSPKPAEFQQFATQVGRTPSIVMWYQPWSQPLFYYSQMQMVAEDGATPLITWDPELQGGVGIPLSQIVDGDYDSYIEAQAQAAKTWGITIYVRFGHEMNLPGSPFRTDYNGNTPQLFVEAWRHVVSIFRSEGATNVKWVWSPNANCAGKCPFQAYYPGNRWVDWVALDGYNYASVDGIPWMSFDQTFQSSYDQLTALTDKPIMIAETASTSVGGDKAAWITQALTKTLPDDMPLVRAIVWFDINKETDWQVNSSPASLRAFREAVDTSAFSGRLPG